MQDRKNDHIKLAIESSTDILKVDKRFYYEPLLSGHPPEPQPIEFLGKKLNYPIWVSSLTGGSKLGRKININLAKVCREYGFGMGLGSCRILLEEPNHWNDFDIRPILGNNLPLYANLGITQIAALIKEKATDKVLHLINKLKADGLTIHVNPLQEVFQPEGDILNRPPLEIIEDFLSICDVKVVVKEVGQGMGKQSLKKLLALPLEAVEFGAYGGTNFPNIEFLRREDQDIFFPMTALTQVGHSAEEMTQFVNSIASRTPTKCQQIIISGGIKNVLDGYYLINTCLLPAIFGMGALFLKFAEDYNQLQAVVKNLTLAYRLAQGYLKIK